MYQKGNNGFEIIALYGGDYKKEFYLREISRLCKMPLKTTQNVLAELEKTKIIKSSTHGKNKYLSLNLENIQTKLYLLQTEIYKTSKFLERYPQFKIFLKSVNSNNPHIIFGSFAKFSADKNSDVDLLIISDSEQKVPYHLLSNKIHKVVLSKRSFINALEEKDALIKEIERNHIILNNHSFYVNTFWGYYGE